MAIKDIKGYEGLYQITDDGKVYSLYSNKFLKTHFDGCGYERVKLYKNHKAISYDIHRLVAIAFIPNPENKEQVNHINGNKTDNRVENLEWNTRQENINHAYETGLKIHGRKVICTEDGNIYNSALEASKSYGLVTSNVYRVCNGERKTTGGLHFKYYDKVVNTNEYK